MKSPFRERYHVFELSVLNALKYVGQLASGEA